MEFELRKNEKLSQYTTLHIGGEADYFAIVKNEDELKAALRFAKANTATPPLILGGGSNMLCSDKGYRGLVIKMEFKGIGYKEEGNTTLVTAAAGESWDVVVADTVEHGLCGLENLSGIPGTTGAAPIQNINAYGSTVAESISSVTVFDPDTLVSRVLSGPECKFGYRDSIFKQTLGKSLVVTAVTFKLAVSGKAELSYRSSSQSIAKYLQENGITKPTPAEVRKAVLFARSNIGMLAGQFNSAGSFFKNVVVPEDKFTEILKTVEETFPEQNEKFSPWHWSLPNGEKKISAAFLLECSPFNKTTYGTKRINGVGLSPKHSLSIVTEAGATSKEVEHFCTLIVESVEEIFGVTLDREVLSV